MGQSERPISIISYPIDPSDLRSCNSSVTVFHDSERVTTRDASDSSITKYTIQVALEPLAVLQ